MLGTDGYNIGNIAEASGYIVDRLVCVFGQGLISLTDIARLAVFGSIML